MSKKPTSFSTLLKYLSKAAECLTDEDIAEVAAGRRRLILTTQEAFGRSPGAEAKEIPDFGVLIASLKSLETRETAHKLLEDAALNRTQLAQLARALDLPTQGSDNVARIQEKIIETTIGFRLTSNAIQKKG